MERIIEMNPLMHEARLAAIVGALMIGGVAAQAAAVVPPIHKAGPVEYLSGGLGLDESKAINNVSQQWPLTLEFAVQYMHRANFAADVKVVILDAKGQALLRADSEGPFFMARLVPGEYVVVATLAGKIRSKKVVVTPAHSAKLVFEWPTDTGESHS
jgi:hypothetical protein